MRKIVLLCLFSPLVSYGDYEVHGTVDITDMQGQMISWNCSPPYTTICFMYEGQGTEPAPGQKVHLKIDDRWFEYELLNATAPVYPIEAGIYIDGSFIGEFVN